jgi:hypothetical protein
MQRDQHDVALPALPIGVGIAAGRCRSHFFPHSPFLFYIPINHHYLFTLIWLDFDSFDFLSKFASFVALLASSGTPKPLPDDGNPLVQHIFDDLY